MSSLLHSAMVYSTNKNTGEGFENVAYKHRRIYFPTEVTQWVVLVVLSKNQE